jgi:hypothetical protein
MKLKTSALIALAGVLALPLASQARSGPAAAVDACVKSFVDTYLVGHPVKQVKKSIPAPSPLEVFTRPQSFTVALTAQGVQSGAIVAQARCVANGAGIVIVLDNPPPSEYLSRADFVVKVH